MVRSIPGEAWFIAAGLALVPVIHVRGASTAVHAALLLAVAALLVVGAWVRRFVLRVEEETPAPAHAVAIGQAALLVYFYLRSALAHLGLPGMAGAELYLLAAAAAVHLLVRRTSRGPASPARTAAYAVVWMAFWASTLTFLGYRSGRLDTPSSDPDQHAFWARLTAEHGRLLYDLLPQNTEPFSYPSGFSALNAIWVDLSHASAVDIVNCQPALQACLMAALVIEAAFALRRGPAPGLTLALLGLAHAVFVFPVNAQAAHFEGTARLAHTALALLPLTFAARLSAGGAPAAPVILVGGFCLALAPVLNPALLLAELPLVAGAALLLRRPDRRAIGALVAASAIAVLLWLSDAWLGPLLTGQASARGTGGGGPLPLHWREAFVSGSSGAAGTNWLGAVCTPGPRCPPIARGLLLLTLPLVLAALAALLARLRWPRSSLEQPARVTLATAVALWTAAFLGPFLDALLADAPGLQGGLLRSYALGALASATAFLFFALLAAALAFASTLPVRPLAAEAAAPVLLAAACFALVASHPDLPAQARQAWSRDVRGAPGSSMGPLLPEDIRVARAAASLVRPGEKILLPGLVKQMNAFEDWYFTLGGARAIPLYSDAPFAFFHTGSPYGPAPALYRDHVCERLDLPWLAERGIVWVYQSAQVSDDVCIRGWPQAREAHFELKLRDGNASLWRLRTR